MAKPKTEGTARRQQGVDFSAKDRIKAHLNGDTTALAHWDWSEHKIEAPAEVSRPFGSEVDATSHGHTGERDPEALEQTLPRTYEFAVLHDYDIIQTAGG